MARMLTCLRYFLIGGAIVVGICGAIESIFAGYFIYQLYEYSPLTPNNVCGSSITLLVAGLITCMIAWCAWQFIDFTNTSQVTISADSRYWSNDEDRRQPISGLQQEWGCKYTVSSSRGRTIHAERHCFRMQLSIVLMIVTIVNASAGIWALMRHEQVDILPISQLEKAFALATTDDKLFWDRMHFELHCCGINGPVDYHNHDAVPWSCCDTVSQLSNLDDNKGICATMYARGCQHVVINRTRSILLHIFLLALGTVLLQVCFVIGMCCYVRACRERLKESVIATQTLARAFKDLGTSDNLLGRQPHG